MDRDSWQNIQQTLQNKKKKKNYLRQSFFLYSNPSPVINVYFSKDDVMKQRKKSWIITQLLQSGI